MVAISTTPEGFPIRVEDKPETVVTAETHITTTPITDNTVNSPITWAQFWGALLNEYLSPPVILAFMMSLANWLGTPGPFTTRVIIQGVILALIAGLEAAKSMSGNSALMLRLRAMGQIGGGK